MTFRSLIFGSSSWLSSTSKHSFLFFHHSGVLSFHTIFSHFVSYDMLSNTCHDDVPKPDQHQSHYFKRLYESPTLISGSVDFCIHALTGTIFSRLKFLLRDIQILYFFQIYRKLSSSSRACRVEAKVNEFNRTI